MVEEDIRVDWTRVCLICAVDGEGDRVLYFMVGKDVVVVEQQHCFMVGKDVVVIYCGGATITVDKGLGLPHKQAWERMHQHA